MKQLAICGKIIDISKIAENTQAQFADQLKRNGVVLEPERLESLYTQLHDGAVIETQIAGMTDEEREAFFEQKRAEAEAK